MKNKRDYPNQGKISVLIPDAEDWQTIKVLRCLGQESTVTNHILSKKKKPLSRFSRYCTSYNYNESKNDCEWIEEINKLVTRLRINIVLPVTLYGVELISKNHNKISKSTIVTPLAEPGKITLTKDKWAFYNFISQHNMPCVPTLNAGRSDSNIETEKIDSLEFPVLLKPTSEAGGFGIVKVENVNDLERAWRDSRIMKNHNYIVQSYVPGEDICLQVFCKAGKIEAYTVQKSLSGSDDNFGPQRFMEFVMDKEVIALGERIISAINWDGIACIDFRIDKRDKKIKILEINPRFGQAILGSLVAGVNFPLIACYSALGKSYPYDYKKTRYAHPVPSVKMFVSRLFGKTTVFENLQWRESGLKFTYSDPFPEIVDLIHKIVCCNKRLSSLKRFV